MTALLETRIKHSEMKVSELANQLDRIDSRDPQMHGSTWPRLAKIAAPVGASYNTYAIQFCDGTYTETAGEQTPTFTERQSAPVSFAHNIGDKEMSVGDKVRVHRISDRWWFQRYETQTEQQTQIGVDQELNYVPNRITGAIAAGCAWGKLYDNDRLYGIIRYETVGIAQGSTIISASIISTKNGPSAVLSGAGSFSGYQGSKAICDIYCEDADDGAVFSLFLAHNDAPTRTRTTAVVSQYTHTFNQYLDNAYVQTPDLSAPIQEVINRPGWTSGNALNFLFDEHNGESDWNPGGPSTDPWGANGILDDYTLPANGSLKLHVTWT